MSEWTRPAQPVRCVVELDKPLAVHRERGVLAQGDANANAIVAEVYSTAGKPYDLSGCAVQLIFVRPDNNALPAINAEISGNTATATLPDSAYAMSGMYSLRMQLRKNGAERTIVWIIGEVKGTDVDGIADPDHVISIGDIMASAKEAQTAASNAKAAAQRANAGAERAEQLQIDASGLAGDSNKLGDKPPEYYLPMVNLIVNSDWRIRANVINQRNVATASGRNTPLWDKWLIYSDDGLSTATLNDGYVTLASQGKFTALLQRFTKNSLSAAKYTMAYKKTDGTIVIDNNPVKKDQTAYDYIQITLPSGAASSLNIEWAALYEGTYTAATLPLYVPRPYAVELAECQRYHLEYDTSFEATGRIDSTGDTAYFYVYTPTKMRKAPSFVPKANATGTIITTVDSHTINMADVSVLRYSGNLCVLKYTFSPAQPAFAQQNCALTSYYRAALNADIK